MNLNFSKFSKKYYTEYKSWFKDEVLNTHLGPINKQWLNHVLSEKDGCQYGIFQEEKLVAVIGIKFPPPNSHTYFITDFAIKPNLRNKGLGSSILSEFIKLSMFSSAHSWQASVDTRNSKAKSFFTQNGWKRTSKGPDKNGMITFKYAK